MSIYFKSKKMEEFIKKFASQFDETEIDIFKPETKFREIPEWSSLTGLCVMSMIYDDYKIRIKAEDMKKAQTIEELYNFIK